MARDPAPAVDIAIDNHEDRHVNQVALPASTLRVRKAPQSMSIVPNVTLPFRPEAAERVRVRAVYLEGQVDLKSFRARHPHYPVLAADPLVTEPVRGSYAVLTKFGSVVFWKCTERTQKDFLADVGLVMGDSPDTKMEEEIEVLVGAGESAVTFNEVRLKELTLDRMTIISLTVAQSVALDHIEQVVAAALRRFEPVVNCLHASGRLRLPVKDVLRAIGFALQVRSSVLANLTLFDKPPETWESEMLERLDSQLYDFFDLEERLSAIKEKVVYFTDMSSMLMNLLNHRRTVQLELAILLLIFIEVLVFLWSLMR